MAFVLESVVNFSLLPCRAGEVLLVLARAFPKCEFHGYDISAKSLDIAKQRQVALLYFMALHHS